MLYLLNRIFFPKVSESFTVCIELYANTKPNVDRIFHRWMFLQGISHICSVSCDRCPHLQGVTEQLLNTSIPQKDEKKEQSISFWNVGDSLQMKPGKWAREQEKNPCRFAKGTLALLDLQQSQVIRFGGVKEGRGEKTCTLLKIQKTNLILYWVSNCKLIQQYKYKTFLFAFQTDSLSLISNFFPPIKILSNCYCKNWRFHCRTFFLLEGWPSINKWPPPCLLCWPPTWVWWPLRSVLWSLLFYSGSPARCYLNHQ